MSSGTTWGDPPTVSQLVAAKAPIMDEFGHVLEGNDQDAVQFGFPHVPGDLVQVLYAKDGVVHPPDLDGTPHSNNVVLLSCQIGNGISPTIPQSGKFDVPLTPRPSGNSWIFVRAFNCKGLASSSFYGDSQLYKVSSFKNEVFYAIIPSTDKPMDPNDDDGDGLSNSLEKSYGSNPLFPDSDRDGVSNSDETFAGTDPYSASSYLKVKNVTMVGNRLVRLQWDGSPWKIYRVERFMNGMEHPSDTVAYTYTPNANIPCEATISEPQDCSMACYRVVLFTP